MKKRIYVALCAAGISLVTGCMSFEEVKNKADAGDAEMQYKMAVMLKKGEGNTADPVKAADYIEKSFKNGYIPAACEIAEDIHRRNDINQSEKLCKCYDLIFNTETFDVKSIVAVQLFRRSFLNQSYQYLISLVENKKYAEASSYKRKIQQYLTSMYYPNVKDIEQYHTRIANIETVSEEEKIKIREQKRIAEEKRIAEQKRIEEEKRIAEQKRVAEQKRIVKQRMNGIKYPYPDLPNGIKFYKHLTSGISLEWFVLETLSKDGQIKCLGKGHYFLILSSTAYPGVKFRFSSDKKDSEMAENINWANYDQKNLSAQHGVLFEVEISLPGNIDSKMIYQKYCNEFPQIKPILKQNNTEKPIPVPPPAYGYRMKVKSKQGQYLWKNDNVYISFSFVDKPEIVVSGPDPEHVSILKRTFEEQQQEMGMGIRRVLVRAEKLYHRFVSSKEESNNIAIKAKEEAKQKAALDF